MHTRRQLYARAKRFPCSYRRSRQANPRTCASEESVMHVSETVRDPTPALAAQQVLPLPDSGALARPVSDDDTDPEQCWLRAALDEVAHGILMVERQSRRVTYLNQAARADLDDRHPLRIVAAEVRARDSSDDQQLREAIVAASARGLRRLLSIGTGQERAAVSVVPLGGPADRRDRPVLLVLGRRTLCESLSIDAFARLHSLTDAESRVLAVLCAGSGPAEAACQLGVALSTIRTQIGSIRAKTGAQSMRELARRIAMLPPLRSALRLCSQGTVAVQREADSGGANVRSGFPALA